MAPSSILRIPKEAPPPPPPSSNNSHHHQKRNVSFAANTSLNTATKYGASSTPTNTNNNTNDTNTKTTHFMHDEEEDIFDPNTSSRKGGDGAGNNTASDDDDRWRDEMQQSIRTAKSTRATNRNSRITADDMDDGTERRAGGNPHRLPGEEEIDKHLSLTHDYTTTTTNDDNEEGTEDLPSDTTKTQCPVEPFNLTSEREDGAGFFDGDTYVFRKRHVEGEEEDAWMDDLDQSKERPVLDGVIPSNSRRVAGKDRGGGEEDMTKEEVYEKFLPLLATDGETVIQALGRYGTILKLEKTTWKRNHKPNGGKQTTTPQNNTSSASHKAFDHLTEYSNFCMMNFEDGGNIYERTKEYFTTFLGINNHQQAEGTKRKQPTAATSYFNNNNNNTESTTSSGGEEGPTSKRTKGYNNTTDGCASKGTNAGTMVQWEYKGNQDNAIHGPYATQQMVDWISAGYFLGDLAVDVRQHVRSEPTEGLAVAVQSTKDDVDDLLGDLDDDDDDDEETEENGGSSAKLEEWMRSNAVNFSSYL